MSDLIKEIKNPKSYFIRQVFNQYMVKWQNKITFTAFIVITFAILFTTIYCGYNICLLNGFGMPFIAWCSFMFPALLLWFFILRGYFKSFEHVAKPLITQYLNLRKQYLNNERDSGFLIWYYVTNNAFIKKEFSPTFSNYLALSNDFNAHNHEGDTLLHLIIRDNSDSPYIAELLLLGADPFIPNKKGTTAADLLPTSRKYLIVNIEKQRLKSSIQESVSKTMINRI